MSKSECIFCKIVAEEVSAEKVADYQNVIAFKDVKPSANTHVLIIPKRHIPSFIDLGNEDENVALQMYRLA